MDFWNSLWSSLVVVWNFFASFTGASVVLNVVVALWAFTGVVWFFRRKNTRLGMGQFVLPIVLYGFAVVAQLILQFITDPGPVSILSAVYNVLALGCFIFSLVNFIIVWFRRKD